MIFLGNIKLLRPVLFIFISVTFCILAQSTAVFAEDSSADSSLCGEVEIIFARGSGQKLNERDYRKIDTSLVNKIKNNGWSTNLYELGSAAQGGHKYEAVTIGGGSQKVNAKFGWGSGTYRDSVSEGKNELLEYMKTRTTKCPASKYVLAGYSQGAHVIGDALEDFTSSTRNKIAYIAYFGEPRLWLPEGRGIWPAACRGSELSEWRRGNPACTVSGGSLSGRNPYVPNDLRNKIGSWCDRKDFVCTNQVYRGFNNSHSEYAERNTEIDQASKEIARKIGFKMISNPARMAPSSLQIQTVDVEDDEILLVSAQSDYYLQPGETAIFDVSQSFDKYGIDLQSFEWDFNNDGIVDAWGKTTEHIYAERYEGFVSLTGTAGYGATAKIQIPIYVGMVPLQNRVPEPVSGLSANQISVQEQTRTVRLSWAEQAAANGYAVYAGDALLGVLEHTQNSIEVEEVAFSESTFSVRGLNEYGESETNTVVLAQYDPPVVIEPEVPSVTVPNKHQLAACKALTKLKPYMHPLAYSILFKSLRC